MGASRAQRAFTAQRRAQAIRLRMAGLEWAEIADKLGYSDKAAAHKDVTRALEQAVVEMSQQAEVLREQEVQRLNRLQASLWADAVRGDIKAAETVLKIIDRRCKLLGLDAPTKYEVVTMDAVEAEIARLERELAERAEAGPAALPEGVAGRT